MQSPSTRSAPPDGEPASEHGEPHVAPLSRTSRVVALAMALLGLGAVGAGVGRRISSEAERNAARHTQVATQRARADAPPAVAVVGPIGFDFEPEYSITGTLNPLQEADVAFNAAGRLRSVDVKLGQRVRPGQLLATLDRRSASGQVEMAAASAQASEAALQLAQDRMQRAEILHAKGATPEAELHAARQQVAIAHAQLAQASAQQRLTSTSESEHVLRAPFAGTVTRVPSGIGEVVTPGRALFHVEDLSSLVLRGGITEKAVPLLRIGDKVELETVPAEGRIQALAPSLDSITRRAPLEIAVPNPDGALVGHTLVKGTIRTRRTLPALLVPPTAMRGDDTLFVVEPDDTIRVRQVQSQIAPDGGGVVLAGLRPEDRVVVRPTPDLTEGLRVKPVTAAPAEPHKP